jgi:hypothetical protein
MPPIRHHRRIAPRVTQPKPRWITHPQSEAEWDQYILKYGQDAPHCYWLAVHYPADQRKRKTAGVSQP